MATFLKNLNAISRGTTLFRDEKLKSFGLNGHQVKYLFAVCNSEGVSQDELANLLFVNKSNVARQMTALEEGGFIRREQSAEDKRVSRVFPTEKAKSLMPFIRSVNDEWRAVLCAGLSEEECGQLSRLLEKLVENARQWEGKVDKNS